MNWKDNLKAINRAHRQNRLVIFVGAGVSMNSSLGSWADLVGMYRDRFSHISVKGIEENYPLALEYYYSNDRSPGKKDFYSVLHEFIGRVGSPNELDRQILRISPNHIVTSNYDHLLEEATGMQKYMYSVLRLDSDFLKKSQGENHYLIKMHGDIDYPESIVLMERDYLEFEYNHQIMSNFIRNLLVDNTFLFVGYSFNDYNLKMVLEWLNHYCRVNMIDRMPVHYMVNVEEKDEFSRAYWRDHNVEIIDAVDVYDEIKDQIDTSMLPLREGKLLSAVLQCVENPKLTHAGEKMSALISSQLEDLKSYRRISADDFLEVSHLESSRISRGTLHFRHHSDYEEYRKVSEEDSPEAEFVRDMLSRTGILRLKDGEGDGDTLLPKNEDGRPLLWKLYMEGRYDDMVSILDAMPFSVEKAYWYFFLRINPDYVNSYLYSIEKTETRVEEVISEERKRRMHIQLWTEAERNIEQQIDKFFQSVPGQDKKQLGYIERLFYSTSSLKLPILKDLVKLVDREVKLEILLEDSRNIVYNYYFFNMWNFIPMKRMKLFIYYFKFLCSAMNMKPDAIVFNEYDLDILVKFSDKDLLRQEVIQKGVKTMNWSVDIAGLFLTYVSNDVILHSKTNLTPVINYAILLQKTELSQEKKREIYRALNGLHDRVEKKEKQNLYIIEEALNELGPDFKI